MKAFDLYKHVRVTNTLHHIFAASRNRWNRDLVAYAAEQARDQAHFAGSLALAVASADTCARRPLALPTASTLAVTAPILARVAKKATPGWLGQSLRSIQGAALTRVPFLATLVERTPILRAGLRTPTVAYGLPLFLAVGSGLRDPDGGTLPNLVPTCGLLGLVQVALERSAENQSSHVLAVACLAAAALLAVPLEAGRLIVFASDQLTLAAVTVVLAAVFAFHNMAQYVRDPYRDPWEYDLLASRKA